MKHERQSFTSRQFAEALGVSESSVKRWVDEGEIIAHRTAGGHRRIPLSSALRFIRKQRARPAKPHLLELGAVPAFGEVDSGAAEELHAALMRDDTLQARAIISGRFLSGASIAAIGDQLLRPALQRIGEIWESDPAGILLEHRAVESCFLTLGEIATWLPAPAPDAPAGITAAGPADPYLLPPMLTFLTLRECGVRVWNIGPFTPLQTVALAISRYMAKLAVLSVSVPQDPAGFRGWIDLTRAAEAAGCRMLLGGRCAGSLPDELKPQTRFAGSMTELAAYASGLVHGNTAEGPSPALDRRHEKQGRP